jgi:hypothetical protein
MSDTSSDTPKPKGSARAGRGLYDATIEDGGTKMLGTAEEQGLDPEQQHEQQHTTEIVDAGLHGLATRRSTKRILLIGLTLAVVGACVAAVVVTTSGTSAAPPTTKSAVYLAEPPVDLDSACSKTTLQDQRKISTCQDKCQSATCCKGKGQKSCLLGNEAMCMEYHSSCSALVDPLQDFNQFPVTATAEASAMLEFCMPDHFNTEFGVRTCHKFCDQAECCWKPGVKSCANSDKCMEYAPCLHLAAITTKNTLTPAPANLESMCSKTSFKADDANVLLCEEKCNKSACCKRSDSSSCLKGNEDLCMEYHQSCSNLQDPFSQFGSAGAIVPKASKSALTEFCKPELFNSQFGIQTCAKFCNEAECCWKPGVITCASNDNCADYGQCLHLHDLLSREYKTEPTEQTKAETEPTEPAPVVPETEAEIFVPETETETEPVVPETETETEPVVPETETESEPETEPAGNGGLSKSLVDEACSEDSIATKSGFTICQDICDGDASQACADTGTCENYSSCTMLKAMVGVEDSTTKLVNNFCTMDKIKTAQGKVLCEDVCKLHRCCYDSTSVGDCPWDDATVCEQYIKCGLLE